MGTLYKDVICMTNNSTKEREGMELYRNKALYTIEMKLI